MNNEPGANFSYESSNPSACRQSARQVFAPACCVCPLRLQYVAQCTIVGLALIHRVSHTSWTVCARSQGELMPIPRGG